MHTVRWMLGFLAISMCFLAPSLGPFAQNNKKDAALVEAASKGDLAAVKRLLSEGVDVESRDDREYTALIQAARWGHPEIVELLLAQGADINARSQFGTTALIEGLEGLRNQDDLDRGSRLIGNPAEGEQRRPAWVRMIHRLLEAGADAKARGDYDQHALIFAAEVGELAIVQALLDKGADPNLIGVGHLPLHEAVSKGHREVVELLLSRGANVNAQDDDGYTARKLAEMLAPQPETAPAELVARWKAIYEILLKAGAEDPNRVLQEAKDPISLYFKSILAHLPDEESRDSLRRNHAPQNFYRFGFGLCEGLKQGQSERFLLEDNYDNFFGAILSKAMLEAAKETICPEFMNKKRE